MTRKEKLTSLRNTSEVSNSELKLRKNQEMTNDIWKLLL